jgi:hypothetical protein
VDGKKIFDCLDFDDHKASYEQIDPIPTGDVKPLVINGEL